MPVKLGILASGGLGYKCLTEILNTEVVDFVFTDAKSENIIELCATRNISIYIGSPRKEVAKTFIKQFNIQVILSINYLFIVDDFIYGHATRYSINFHGSLLPKYRGRTPHIWAIINNEKEAGITAHLISEGCDEGDIVYQEKIQIDDLLTGGQLLSQYSDRYPHIINEVLLRIKNNSLLPIPQDHSKATFFGKRTPEDGSINWDWQKERIHNWVRALSSPYPGAFSFINGSKIIINKIDFTNHGFIDTDVNGKIINIENNKVVVKVQNGTIALIDFKTEMNITFNIGDLLYARN